MKKILILISVAVTILSMTSVFANDVWVNGYQKDNGTYVEGHHRSSPDNRTDNNYNNDNNNPYRNR